MTQRHSAAAAAGKRPSPTQGTTHQGPAPPHLHTTLAHTALHAVALPTAAVPRCPVIDASTVDVRASLHTPLGRTTQRTAQRTAHADTRRQDRGRTRQRVSPCHGGKCPYACMRTGGAVQRAQRSGLSRATAAVPVTPRGQGLHAAIRAGPADPSAGMHRAAQRRTPHRTATATAPKTAAVRYREKQ